MLSLLNRSSPQCRCRGVISLMMCSVLSPGYMTGCVIHINNQDACIPWWQRGSGSGGSHLTGDLQYSPFPVSISPHNPFFVPFFKTTETEFKLYICLGCIFCFCHHTAVLILCLVFGTKSTWLWLGKHHFLVATNAAGELPSTPQKYPAVSHLQMPQPRLEMQLSVWQPCCLWLHQHGQSVLSHFINM